MKKNQNSLTKQIKKGMEKFNDAVTFGADQEYQNQCLNAAVNALAALKGWTIQPRNKDKKNK